MTENASPNYCYNKTERKKNTARRKGNINAFTNMINGAKIKNNNLRYNREVNRIVLYKTSNNEKICIQFPGKESARTKNIKPYDFKPVILKEDGLEIKDMSFSDIFEILSKITDNTLLESLALILFKIGHLVLHDNKDEIYQETNIIGTNIHIFETASEDSNTALSLQWHKLNLNYEDYIDNATQNALQRIAECSQQLHIISTNGEPIRDQAFSLEAFLYFMDLLMLNEDIKYNYILTKDIHGNEMYCTKLSQKGRKGTNDLLLGFILFLLKKIRLSVFLQKLVMARGTLKFENEYYNHIPNLSINLQ